MVGHQWQLLAWITLFSCPHEQRYPLLSEEWPQFRPGKPNLDWYVLQQLFLEGCMGARIGTAHSVFPN